MNITRFAKCILISIMLSFSASLDLYHVEISPGNKVYEGVNVTLTCWTDNIVLFHFHPMRNFLLQTFDCMSEPQNTEEFFVESNNLTMSCSKIGGLIQLKLYIPTVAVNYDGIYTCPRRWHHGGPIGILTVFPSNQLPLPVCTYDNTLVGYAITCSSFPEDSLQWYRNDILQSTEKADGNLSLALNLQEDNFAIFKCTAVFNGHQRSCEIVPLTASITKHPPEAIAENEMVMFKCDPTGYPPTVNIIWYIGSTAINDLMKEMDDFDIITIKNQEFLVVKSVSKEFNGTNVACIITLEGMVNINVSVKLDMSEQLEKELVVYLSNETMTQKPNQTSDRMLTAELPLSIDKCNVITMSETLHGDSFIKYILIAGNIISIIIIVIIMLFCFREYKLKKDLQRTANIPAGHRMDIHGYLEYKVQAETQYQAIDDDDDNVYQSI